MSKELKVILWIIVALLVIVIYVVLAANYDRRNKTQIMRLTPVLKGEYYA